MKGDEPTRVDQLENVLERCIEALDRGDEAEIEQLCAAHPQHADALREQLVDLRHLRARPSLGSGEEHPQQVGPYRVLDVLGEGGMGTVFLADQRDPVRRRVALKIIKLGMDSKQVLARFEAERQALALMNHDNIARVFDAGTTDRGQPFFAMELVRGVPLTEHCDRHRASVRERLELFVQVCAGVQHAHQKGIMHRDLKPSNVLVTVEQGHAVPKIIDFGLARATDNRLAGATLVTGRGHIVGTPAYMSPEQADPTAQGIDTRTDVYSLGVMLYELLVGLLPFASNDDTDAGFAEMQRRVREDDPPKPSTRLSRIDSDSSGAAQRRRTTVAALSRELRGDLDWIAMKALEKDPNRRFVTVAAMAEDIERFLRSEPITARPPSASYRMAKFVRRYRGRVAAAMVLLLAIVTGAIVSTVGFLEAKRQARIAWLSNTIIEDMFASVNPELARGKDLTLKEVLDDTARRIENTAWEDPEVDGWIHRLLGQTYGHLGRAERGEHYLRRSVERLRTAFGHEDPRTLRAMNDLGVCLHRGDKHEEARRVLEAAVAGRSRALGTEHRDTLRSEHNLAAVMFDQDERDVAERMQGELLARQTEQLGERDPDTLASLSSLGSFLTARGAYAEAEPLVRRAVQAAQATLGNDHPETLIMRHNLAALLRRTGKESEAEQSYREVLDLQRTVRSPDHPYTLETARMLGALLVDRREFIEAQELLRDTVERSTLATGPASDQTLNARGTLAYALEQSGAQQEAEEIHRDVLRLRRAHSGEKSPGTLKAMDALGRLLQQRGKLSEAAPLLTQAFELRLEQHGERDLRTLTSINNLALVHSRLGELARAEELYRRSLELRRSVLGPDKARTLLAHANLCSLLRKRGKLAEAERELRELLETSERTVGAERVSILAASHLGHVLVARGDHAQALNMFRTAHRRTVESTQPDDWQRFHMQHFVGQTLMQLGRVDEAEVQLDAAVGALRRILGDSHRNTRAAIAALAELYEKTGRPDHARALREAAVPKRDGR